MDQLKWLSKKDFNLSLNRHAENTRVSSETVCYKLLLNIGLQKFNSILFSLLLYSIAVSLMKRGKQCNKRKIQRHQSSSNCLTFGCSLNPNHSEMWVKIVKLLFMIIHNYSGYLLWFYGNILYRYITSFSY